MAGRAQLCCRAAGHHCNSHGILATEEREPKRIKSSNEAFPKRHSKRALYPQKRVAWVISSCTVRKRVISLFKLSNTKILFSGNHVFLIFVDFQKSKVFF